MRELLELVLEVNDLEQSVAFYRDLLQLSEVEHWPAPRLATWLSIGRNGVIGLWPRASGGEGVAIAGSRGGSHAHFAIEVRPGTLLKSKQRLRAPSDKVRGRHRFRDGRPRPLLQ